MAKKRAKKKGLEFSITIDDLPIPEICPIACIPLKIRDDGVQGPWDYSPSVDRIDLDKGYVPGNVRVISHRGNRWKNDMTIEDVERLLAYMKDPPPVDSKVKQFMTTLRRLQPSNGDHIDVV